MQSLKSEKLVFLDVETTGLSPAQGDRVVEIALIACNGRQCARQFSSLVNPQRPIPRIAQNIHGITTGTVAKAPVFSSIAQEVCELLDGAWIVGHHLQFDAAFIAMELAMTGLSIKPKGCLDTCWLAKATWYLTNYKLETIVRELGLGSHPRHRALDDARATRAIFMNVIRQHGGWSRVRAGHLRTRQGLMIRWPNHETNRLRPALLDWATV